MLPVNYPHLYAVTRTNRFSALTYQKLLDKILGFGKELLWKLILQLYYFLENQVLVSGAQEK